MFENSVAGTSDHRVIAVPARAAWPTLAHISVAINLAITLPLATVLNIWQDEAYTMHTTGGTVGYAFSQALGFEQNAPLYFVLMSVWRHVNGSLFFARLFSVLCVALAIALVPKLVSRYLPSVNPGWVALALALNPFSIWAAVEVRLYALLVLISALFLLVFYDGFLDETTARSRLWTPVYALLVAIALYTQYYAVFLVAAQGLTLLIYARRSIARYAGAVVAAFAAFLPLAVYLPSQIRNFHGAFQAPRSLLQSIVTNLEVLAQYILPIYVFGRSHLWYLVAVAIAAALFFALRSRFSRHGSTALALTTVLATVLLAIGLYVAHIDVLNRRELGILFVPGVVSTFAIPTFLREPERTRAVTIWACVSIAISLVALVSTYRPLAKTGDWIRVAAYLHEDAAHGEPIVVFEAENALPLSYYYSGPSRVVPIPAGVDFRTFDVTRFVLKSQRQVAQVMPSSPRIWLVTAGNCHALNIDFGCGILAHYVAQHYRIASTERFYGSTVRLLTRS
jgi:Dolichyl-phosphate-mannose-protein mannosyltransferase